MNRGSRARRPGSRCSVTAESDALGGAPQPWLGLEAVLIGCIYKAMSLYIRSEEADRLARQLAERTGLTLTEVVTRALRAEHERTPHQADDRAARQARNR